MRIGSAIVFLVTVLLVCGYLFSDNIHMRQDLQAANQRIASLVRERDAIQGQLDAANSQAIILTGQNEELRRQLQLLDGQIKQLQAEIVRIQDQNAQLHSELDQVKKLNALIENIAGRLPQSLELALLVPLLPVSLAATFVIYRYSQRHSGRKNDQPEKPKRHISVSLTEDEIKEIIKMRRKK